MLWTPKEGFIFTGKEEVKWAYGILELYLPFPPKKIVRNIKLLTQWCKDGWHQEANHVCLCKDRTTNCNPGLYCVRGNSGGRPKDPIRLFGFMMHRSRDRQRFIVVQPNQVHWLVKITIRFGHNWWFPWGYKLEELKVNFVMGDIPPEFLELVEEVDYPGGRQPLSFLVYCVYGARNGAEVTGNGRKIG